MASSSDIRKATFKYRRELLSAIVIFIAAGTAVAQEHGAHHGPAHLTNQDIKKIIYQCINLAILFGALFFALRKTVVASFRARGETFEKQVASAKKAKQDAEHHHVEMKSRLKHLEDSAAASIARAKDEAEALRRSMREEAQRVAARIEAEAQRTAEVERERAVLHLREEIVDLGIKNARAFMSSSVGDAEQKRLNQEFIEKIQVRP